MSSLYFRATASPAIAPTDSAATTATAAVRTAFLRLLFFALSDLSDGLSSSASCSAYAVSAAFFSSKSPFFIVAS